MNDTPTNGNAVATTKPRTMSQAAVFQHDMGNMEGGFLAALPKHIPVERFMRVVQTAVLGSAGTSNDLLKADRKSLWMACTKCAQDGLLPDGREAALINRGGTVVYQPMIAGVRKKARNSGEISTWDAHVVCEGDHFIFQLGDDPHIEHSYNLKNERGAPIGAYSVAVLKDGSKSYEVMSVSDIYKIRDQSDAWKAFKAGKIKSTPWSSNEGEMMRKTVAKRHSKVLPMSTDLDDLMRRDDELYDFKQETDAARTAAAPPKTLAGRLNALAGNVSREDEARAEGADVETGEVIDQDDGKPAGGESTAESGPEAGGGGNAAGQGSSPATAAPAAAVKEIPAAKLTTKPKAAAKKSAPEPQPAQAQEQPAPAQEPANDDDDEQIPESLRREEEPASQAWNARDKAVLNGYHQTLMNTMSTDKLVKASAEYFEGEVPAEGTPIGDAVFAIYRAHHERINEDRSPGDVDAFVKGILDRK